PARSRREPPRAVAPIRRSRRAGRWCRGSPLAEALERLVHALREAASSAAEEWQARSGPLLSVDVFFDGSAYHVSLRHTPCGGGSLDPLGPLVRQVDRGPVR